MGSGSGKIPKLIGILNLTADSFSDGGMYPDTGSAVFAAEQMLRAGAAGIDVGAESTRPGAAEVSAEAQLAVLLPVVRLLAGRCPVSVDTRNALVADAVLSAGADTVNDVSGLRHDPAMADVIAKHQAGLVLTHSRGIPETMQQPENLQYDDLIGEINAFFAEQIEKAVSAGIRRNRIILDPGVGFSKTEQQNFELIRSAEAFRCHGLPLYYGVSRKAFLKNCCRGGGIPAERDFATAGILAVLTLKQVDYLRVHHISGAWDAVHAAGNCIAGE